jgi:hypothetical protein
MAEQIPVTIVNHLGVDIGVLPGAVWQVILDEYVEAKKFREIARIEPLDDPSAVLGGYRMRLEYEGVVDERVIRFTERDEAARRLSIFADYLTAPAGGMRVWVTYQAQEIPGGSRFTIDCHTGVGIDTPASGAKADVAAVVAGIKLNFDTALIAYLEQTKMKLEGAQSQG